VADLLEAAFMDITGVQVAGADDIRARIAFGDRAPPTQADDLALAQLRLLQEPDAALVASLDDDSAFDTDESTIEGMAMKASRCRKATPGRTQMTRSQP